MTTNLQGSQWRKWDLHIHVPSSALNNQFQGSTIEEKWAACLEKLEVINDVAVLGVTDYFSIDGYLFLKEQQEAGRIQNISLILPNVELRIFPVTSENRAINLHILFDPNPEVVQNLNTYFFQELKFEYNGNTYRCTSQDMVRLGRAYKNDDSLEKMIAYEDGVNQFKVSHAVVRKILQKNDHLKGRYLVGVSNNSSDGNSGIQHSSLAATRQEIYRLSHFIFSANPNDRKYFLGHGVDSQEIVEANYGSLKPCFHGSDAHCLDDLCKPNENRFTWIKADPTFEGLKQTIYEPEDRVRIQSDNPVFDYPKHYFSSLRVEGSPYKHENLKFSKTNIPLNRELVTIIGGRGSGKSMLLDTLYYTFKRSDNDGRFTEFQKIPFSVSLQKGTTDEKEEFHLNENPAHFEYLHVRQGHIKRLVDRPKDLHNEVLRLLGLSKFNPDPILEEELESRNEQIFNIREFLRKRDESGNLINSVEYHERQIEQNRALLKTLATKETKTQIQEFTDNSNELSNFETFVQEIKKLRYDLTEFSQRINEKIETANSRFPNNKDSQIMQVNFSQQIYRRCKGRS